MTELSVDEVARRLYREPPDGFVATRTAAIEEARRSGDRAAARRLAALKKPTVAAWVINLLAVERPDLIAELVDLSAALRSAQRDLQGAQLRDLSTQRRRFVSALVTTARNLALAATSTPAPGSTSGSTPAPTPASGSGSGSVKLPLGEVEATLTAALADPDIAAQVRTGRLIRAATYDGFGEVPRPRLRLITGDAVPDSAVTPPDSVGGNKTEISVLSDSDTGLRREEAEQGREVERVREAERVREVERKLRRLRREMAVALDAEESAAVRLGRAEEGEREAEGLVEELDAEIAELERRRAEAVAEVARRKLARRNAERAAAGARRRVGDVQAALDDLGDDPG
ncbi:hypothetical protein [Actinoplanes sp. NPDC051851]|uniref:hypothetical protein n=1 Tax=Actinoplanes sp. NPDC051851 TaxID=3154753 RepID=UPI003443FD80